MIYNGDSFWVRLTWVDLSNEMITSYIGMSNCVVFFLLQNIIHSLVRLTLDLRVANPPHLWYVQFMTLKWNGFFYHSFWTINQVIIRRQESNLLMFFRPRYRNSSNKQIRATNNFFFKKKGNTFLHLFFLPRIQDPVDIFKKRKFFFNAFIYLGTPFESHLCSKIWRKNCSRKNI